MGITTFDITETVVVTLQVRVDEILTDPASTPTVSIWDPDDVLKVDAASMSKDDTGEYHYDYNPAADATAGTYKTLCNVVDGSRITKVKGNFILEAV